MQAHAGPSGLQATPAPHPQTFYQAPSGDSGEDFTCSVGPDEGLINNINEPSTSQLSVLQPSPKTDPERHKPVKGGAAQAQMEMAKKRVGNHKLGPLVGKKSVGESPQSTFKHRPLMITPVAMQPLPTPPQVVHKALPSPTTQVPQYYSKKRLRYMLLVPSLAKPSQQ